MRYASLFCCVFLCLQPLYAQVVLTNVSSQTGVVHHAVMGNFDMPGQGGAAWFDMDNDGWYDLYLTGGSGPDALFKNNGDGTFTDIHAIAGLSTVQLANTNGVTTGDVNNDGWDDLFVTTFRTSDNYLFLNDGNGTFTHQTNWAGTGHMANSFSASFGDLNLDGWLDLFVCNWSRFMDVTINGANVSVDSEANFYYQNNGDGTFIEQAAQLQIDDTLGCALGVMFTDFDNDHDPDLFVSNDFGFFSGNSPNRMFKNNHPIAAMEEVSSELGLDVGMNGMGVARSDQNGDGIFDFYITNIRNDKLMISSLSGYEDELVSRGLHNDSVWLQDMSQRHWKVGWGVGFLDIDNDMDEDLMIANGSLAYDYPHPALDSNKLFLNDGNGSFTDISFEIGMADTYVSRALAYCDYDLDGDLDVFIGITDSISGSSNSFLYRNDSAPKNWLQVKAKGVQNNPNGIGARVVVFIDGQSQMREIGGESSYNSQHWQVAHFGLGDEQTVDSLHVQWYGGGIDRYYDLQTNQFLLLEEGQGLLTGLNSKIVEEFLIHPNPIVDVLTVSGPSFKSISIYDVNGRLCYRSSANEKNIDTTLLSKGSYLLKIELDNGEHITKRFVKE